MTDFQRTVSIYMRRQRRFEELMQLRTEAVDSMLAATDDETARTNWTRIVAQYEPKIARAERALDQARDAMANAQV